MPRSSLGGTALRAGWIVCALAAAACGPTLHERVRRGDLQGLRAAVEGGADLGASEADGVTALHVAAVQGRLDAALLLLDHGASVHALTVRDRNTPLHAAALTGRAEIARLLIERGADLEARNSDGMTPLLFWAAYSGDIACGRVLLDAGADPRAASKRGLTSLHWAALRWDVPVIELLLAAGADPEARDAKGRSPRDVALQAERREIADLLGAARP